MKRTTTIEILAFVAVLVGGSHNSAGADEVADADAAVVANDDEWGPGDFDRWSLGLSVGFDVMLQDAHGSVDTNFVEGTDYSGGSVLNFKPQASGSNFFLNPMFGLNVELTTPAPFDLPGKPRLYLGAGVRYVQKLPHSIGSSGDKRVPHKEEEDFFLFPKFVPPGGGSSLDTVIDDGFGNNIVNPRCAEPCRPFFIAGQGVGVEAEFGHFYWETEIGLVFTIPLEERSLLIKPAVGFFQQKMKIEGYAHRTYRSGPRCPAKPSLPCEDPDGLERFYTSVEIDKTLTPTFNSIGPKLTLELEAMRFSRLGQRFGVSIFADAGAFWMIGKREIKFDQSVDVPGDFLPVQDLTQTASYSFGFDKISYQLGVGFKMSWYPR